MPQIDDDIMRELMVRATSDMFASPAATAAVIRHQRQRRLRTRVLGAAGGAAAAGLAVGTIVTSSGSHPGPGSAAPGSDGVISAHLTAAQHTLFGLSAAAAATPRPAGRYAVLTEKTITVDGEGTVAGGKTSVIDGDTGATLSYQDIKAPGQPAPPATLKNPAGSSPTTARLDALPTAQERLRAALLAQARQQQAESDKLAQQQLERGHKPGRATTTGPQPTDNDLVFDQATDLLWEPGLSPALRSALYKVLAGTPGVAVSTGARDSSGRPAVEISRVANAGKTDVQTFEDPKTGATLESAWRQASGEFSEDLYLSVSYTNHIPANPYRH
jgi:hypothetical protein